MADAGKHVPAIEEMPTATGLEWYMTAFRDLSSCRSLGMGLGPIPWTAIEAYAYANDLDDYERWELHTVIRHVDGVWLEVNSGTA